MRKHLAQRMKWVFTPTTVCASRAGWWLCPCLASASADSCHTGASYNSLAPCLTFCDPKPKSWPRSWLFHSPYPSALALTTCLSLSVGEDLTADPRHARNGVGNDWSCSEGAQDLGLSPEGSSTDLWVEGEPCSEAEGRERTQGRGKRVQGTGVGR